MVSLRRWSLVWFLALAVCFRILALGADGQLHWNRVEGTVSADVRGWDLERLLTNVAAQTGWEVFMDPGAELNVSVKFGPMPYPDGLQRLLGRLNYALVGQTNGPTRLYVFRTSMAQATRQLTAAAPKTGVAPDAGPSTNRVPRELVVRLKPGVSIDDLARRLGARVTGRLDEFGVYRLRFDSEDALERARDLLTGNTDVESVEYNYVIGPPGVLQPALAGAIPALELRLKPSAHQDKLIVGLIDTAVQSLGSSANSFLLPALSVSEAPGNAVGSEPTHGTAMAGTILLALQSVAAGETAVRILPVDVYGGGQFTTTFDVAKGIVLAVNGGATLVNLSLGTTADSTVLRSVIESASAKGVVFVAAAGNRPTTDPVYPAAYEPVLAVTALDPATGSIADYASRGAFVDMVAPGVSAFSFNGRVYVVGGTSSAAALVSGTLAGLADKSGKSPREVRDRLAAAGARSAQH